MSRSVWSLFVSCAVFLAAAPVEASDPIGVYAWVEKIILEPSPEAPERAQIWGAFSVSRQKRGDEYAPPQFGYIYCSLPTEKTELARNEWKDLQRAADQGQIVGFGSRYKGGLMRVRGSEEEAESPDVYVLGWGVRLLKPGHKYFVADRLRRLPRPVSPAPSDEISAQRTAESGPLTLTAHTCLSTTAQTRYLFELEGANGHILASPPVAAEGAKVSWQPPLRLESGMRYTWRVRIVGGESSGAVPVARSHFVTTQAKSKS